MATVGITSTRDVLRHVDSLLVGGSRLDTVELLRGREEAKDGGGEVRSNLGECTCPISGVEIGDGEAESSRMGGGIVRELDEDERLLVISSRLIFRFMSEAGFLGCTFRRCVVGLAESAPPRSSLPPNLRGLGGGYRVTSEPCLLPTESCLLAPSSATPIWRGEGLRVKKTLREKRAAPDASFSFRQRFLVAELKYLVNHTHSHSGIGEHSQPYKSDVSLMVMHTALPFHYTVGPLGLIRAF